MFRHVMGNDPRPHFFHQSNLADYNPALPETDPNQGGILYPVVDGLLGALRRGVRPRERAAHPARRARRSPRRSPSSPRGRRTSPRAGSRPSCRTACCTSRTDGAAMDVPLTGTTVGRHLRRPEVGVDERRRRRRAGLLAERPGQRRGADGVGHAEVGQTLTASRAPGPARAPIDYGYQWQRCDAGRCANIAGATGATYRVSGADGGAKLRVVVSAGNWISSVSQAASALTARRVPKVARGAKSKATRSPRAWR